MKNKELTISLFFLFFRDNLKNITFNTSVKTIGFYHHKYFLLLLKDMKISRKLQIFIRVASW